MKSRFLARAAIGFSVAAMFPSAAMAQAIGAEVVGQPIQVTTNGVTNTVYLDAGGQLRVITPGGATVPGSWTAANGQLCLSVGGAQECVPYASPFQAGAPITLTSSCGSSETWLASATNQGPTPPAPAERGR